MPIYNNPVLGKAFNSLAGAFAPMSASDQANYAKASAINAEAQRLADLYANPNMDDFDRRAMVAGAYDPDDSLYAVDLNSATTRRGQDVAARSALDVTNANNVAALARQNALPVTLKPGETAHLPSQTQNATGLGPTLQGNEKPLTESEMIASILGNLPPEKQELAALGDAPVEQVLVNGQSQYVYRPDAVGQQPAPTGARKNGVAVLPDGSRAPVTQDHSTGAWHLSQTGEALPEGAEVTNIPTPTGSNEDLGLTTSTNSLAQKRFMSNRRVLDLAGEIRELIANNPGSMGVVGSLRKMAQNPAQTVPEASEFTGGRGLGVAEAINRGLIDEGLASEFFNPALPELDSALNEMVWAYASSQQADGRVSNQQMEQTRKAFGVNGPLANTQQLLAAINRMAAQVERDQERLGALVPDNIRNAYGSSSAPVAPGASPPVPAAGGAFEVQTPNGTVIIRRKGAPTNPLQEEARPLGSIRASLER